MQVEYIEGKLAELDQDRKELTEYQALDKQLRSIEYTLFDTELSDAQDMLQKVWRRVSWKKKRNQLNG